MQIVVNWNDINVNQIYTECRTADTSNTLRMHILFSLSRSKLLQYNSNQFIEETLTWHTLYFIQIVMHFPFENRKCGTSHRKLLWYRVCLCSDTYTIYRFRFVAKRCINHIQRFQQIASINFTLLTKNGEKISSIFSQLRVIIR